MRKVKAIFEITRPVNLIITFVVVITSAIICSNLFTLSNYVFWAGISAVLVAASGNIINDYFDIGIDIINRPNRPIPSGRISKNEALLLYIILVLSALFIAYLISFESVVIVLATIILLFFYSSYFKGVPLVGNIIVASCTALAFIYGGVVVSNVVASFIPAIFAFLINFIREILKDIEDIEGDRKNNISTFPIKFGINASKNIILVLALILILATFYPFAYQLYKIEYFIVVLFFVNIPIIYICTAIFKKDFLLKLYKLNMYLKLIMIFGLLAISIGQI